MALLAGGRLHLQDGPIDLVIGADGPAALVRQAYDDAIAQFIGLLGTLCTELPVLRAAASPDLCAAQGTVARSMWNAVRPFAGDMFITPMAAVAGAVAGHVLSALARPGLTRAYVNNGGDIALYLAEGANFTVGLIDRPDRPSLTGTARIDFASPVRGIATSGDLEAQLVDLALNFLTILHFCGKRRIRSDQRLQLHKLPRDSRGRRCLHGAEEPFGRGAIGALRRIVDQRIQIAARLGWQATGAGIGRNQAGHSLVELRQHFLGRSAAA
ncbi:MAG: hypothetical protein B7X76_08115, partial [Azorhizobium sp. 39-67-5]